MLNAAHLPNDIEALKALLLVGERRVQERDDQVARLEAQLHTRAAEIDQLKCDIDHGVPVKHSHGKGERNNYSLLLIVLT